MTAATLVVRIEGVAPLLMHSGTLADPLDPIAREISRISSRKKKCEADLERLGDLEFTGGLWLDAGRPCIRRTALKRAICESAAHRRMQSIYRGAVICRHNAILEYEGPASVEDLRADPAFRDRSIVAINRRRLVRTRPKFTTWSAEVALDYLPSSVNRRDLLEVLIHAGDVIGVGDNRPDFGRFAVVASPDDI